MSEKNNRRVIQTVETSPADTVRGISFFPSIKQETLVV